MTIRFLATALSLSFILPAVLPGQSASALTPEKNRSMKRETRLAIEMLQNHHLKQMLFAEVGSRDLLTNYVESLDEQKLFLLQSDMDFILERFERTLKPSYLFVGDLYPAFEIYDIYQDRVLARLDWVAQRIEGDFELDSEDEIMLDRSELPWPTNEAEADTLWERRLRFDLIAELLEDEPIEQAREKIAARFERRRKFLNEFEPHNVQETFLSSLTELYDPHSQFFSWDSAQEFDIEISNSLIGIGAQLRDVEGFCVVERILPGGPAEQSGEIHPGDRIVAVAQGEGEPVDVIGLKLRRIVHMIRGEIGTELKLTIQPPEGDKRRIVSLNRDRIELAANLANGTILQVPQGDQTVPVGVIELPSFYGEGDFDGTGTSTSQDVRELIEKLQEYNIEGLVLDLRRNGGGRLDEAVALTGLFIENGPVVMKRSYDGQVSEDWDEDSSVAYDGPLVVLTSRMSASASEIMAGALKSYNRAVVVGDQSTYGKGTVQTLVDLKRMVSNPYWSTAPEWGMLKLTIQQFYLPDGVSTQELGVPSHIVLPSLTESLIETEGEQPHALAWDEISPISFEEVESKWTKPFAAIDDSLVSILKARSGERIETLPEFALQISEQQWRKDLIERDAFSLNLEKTRRTAKLAQEEQRQAYEDERKDLGAALAFEAEPVDLALSVEQDKVHQEKLRETPLPNGQARANQFFQKVFYYQAEPDGDIEEIWVEYIDYEEMMKHTEELATVLAATSEVDVSGEQMSRILLLLKNADRLGTFDVITPFTEVLGEQVDPEQIKQGLPSFFTRVVQLDEDILRERPVLDVHLRESLRIVADWIELSDADPDEKLALAAAITDPRESVENELTR